MGEPWQMSEVECDEAMAFANDDWPECKYAIARAAQRKLVQWLDTLTDGDCRQVFIPLSEWDALHKGLCLEDAAPAGESDGH